MRSLTAEQLDSALESIRRSPATDGRIELIVRRPALREREVVDEAELDPTVGLVGDTWRMRPSRHSDDGGPHPGMQITVMNARAIALVAGTLDRWPLAGDQLYVDLDLSPTNLPTGTRLEVGEAVIEVTAAPHNGCAKFREHFGAGGSPARELARGQGAAPPGHQHPGGDRRSGAARRSHTQSVTTSPFCSGLGTLDG